MKKTGFTLIELLVVIAIVGIIAVAIGIPSLRSFRASQMGEAAGVVFTEFNRARSAAQRTSANQTITWTATSITVTPGTGAGRTTPIPNGVKIVPAPAAGLVYTAPYGELSTPAADGQGFRMELATSTLHTSVDAAGVLGKPIRRRVVDLSTSLDN